MGNVARSFWISHVISNVVKKVFSKTASEEELDRMNKTVSRLLQLTALVSFAGCQSLPENTQQTIDWTGRLAPSRVKVAYTLRYDNNEAPSAAGVAARCPNCGTFHGGDDGENMIHQKRPLEMAGWLVAPQRVLITDPQVTARFIEQIRVSQGESSVSATEAEYFFDRNALLLKLDKPLPAAKELVFAGDTKKEAFFGTYVTVEGEWHGSVQRYARTASVAEKAGPFLSENAFGVVLDAQGKPTRMAVPGRLTQAAATANYTEWKSITPEAYAQWRKTIEAYLGKSLCMVTLQFRSPKVSSGSREMYSFSSDDEENSSATVQYAVACKISPTQFLVLRKLSNAQTARLEKMFIQGADKKPLEATFAGSLAEYGGFLVTCEKAAGEPLPLFASDLADCRGQLISFVKMTTQNGDLLTFFDRSRIEAFDVGHKAMIFPEFRQRGRESLFAFDATGRLLVLPISLRTKGEERSYRSGDDLPMPAMTLAKLVKASAPELLDTANVPLSAKDENRIAWLGADLQELTPELASVNKVAHLVKENYRNSGGLVTFVYPQSPAAKAGLQAGDVLLRLYVPGEQAPIKITVADGGRFGEQGFPWERLDELPAEMAEHIPSPWPAIKNPMTETLTQIGIGKPYSLEYARKGEVKKINLIAEQSPTYYGNAEKVELKDVGISVCDMTFEVMHYLNRKPTDPGVIVARLEAGTPAAVAGIKPFELLTHVDDQPVRNAEELKKLIAGKKEVRFMIRRLSRERIVPLRPGEKPAIPTPPETEE
jgi:serine protease Do